jgi:ribose transport system permease protein
MLGVIDNMLILLDVSPHLHGMVKGLVIIVAVLAQRGRRSE